MPSPLKVSLLLILGREGLCPKDAISLENLGYDSFSSPSGATSFPIPSVPSKTFIIKHLEKNSRK